MNEEQLYEKLLAKEIAVNFSDIDAFRIFCGFLRSKGINHKNSISYYWKKYDGNLSVIISDLGNFKTATPGFYKNQGRDIYTYDKKPYIVKILDEVIL